MARDVLLLRRYLIIAAALFTVIGIYYLAFHETSGAVISAVPPNHVTHFWNENEVFANRQNICERIMRPLKGSVIDSPPPPKWEQLTIAQQQAYLLNNRAKKVDMYYDDRMVSTVSKARYRPYSRSEIDALIEKARRREINYYDQTDIYLYDALDKYPIKGKDVAILGSLEPWYEAVCIAFEAKSCTSVEYNELEYDHPSIKTITVKKFLSMKNRPVFDAAFSISSYEHDGLGRYGDPLNPFGDLQTMWKTKCYFKEGGLLYLSVPVGPDTVRWNADRIYGAVRLPMLLRPFTTIGTFGMSLDTLEREGKYTQPVFVLLNGPFIQEEIYNK